jgi:hypothetical protein
VIAKLTLFSTTPAPGVDIRPIEPVERAGARSGSTELPEHAALPATQQASRAAKGIPLRAKTGH